MNFNPTSFHIDSYLPFEYITLNSNKIFIILIYYRAASWINKNLPILLTAILYSL